MKSFNRPLILLAGGANKGAKFKKLAREIKKKVKFAVLFKGQSSPRIKRELLKINFPGKNIATAGSMSEAVGKAFKKAAAGDIVLLSPACASFGLFKNYKERGELFKKEVFKLNEKK